MNISRFFDDVKDFLWTATKWCGIAFLVMFGIPFIIVIVGSLPLKENFISPLMNLFPGWYFNYAPYMVILTVAMGAITLISWGLVFVFDKLDDGVRWIGDKWDELINPEPPAPKKKVGHKSSSQNPTRAMTYKPPVAKTTAAPSPKPTPKPEPQTWGGQVLDTFDDLRQHAQKVAAQVLKEQQEAAAKVAAEAARLAQEKIAEQARQAQQAALAAAKLAADRVKFEASLATVYPFVVRVVHNFAKALWTNDYEYYPETIPVFSAGDSWQVSVSKFKLSKTIYAVIWKVGADHFDVQAYTIEFKEERQYYGPEYGRYVVIGRRTEFLTHRSSRMVPVRYRNIIVSEKCLIDPSSLGVTLRKVYREVNNK